MTVGAIVLILPRARPTSAAGDSRCFLHTVQVRRAIQDNRTPHPSLRPRPPPAGSPKGRRHDASATEQAGMRSRDLCQSGGRNPRTDRRLNRAACEQPGDARSGAANIRDPRVFFARAGWHRHVHPGPIATGSGPGEERESAVQTLWRERRANETYREHNCTGTECSGDEVTIDSSLSHSRDRRWKAVVD
jgi:hypothetical protein